MQSHSDGEAWALAVCPQTGLVLTSADDNKILVWDPEARKCIAQAIINETPGIRKKIGGASTLSILPPNQQSRAVAINPTSGHVAVATNTGEVHIHSDLKSLGLVKKLTPSKEWIEVIQYSPDGSRMAVGSHDNRIYIFEAENYELVATCSKHNAFITALDWTTDSNYIQSVDGAYELLFFNGQTGDQMPEGATDLRDADWATFTIKLGWPVQGVFPPGTDGTYVNGVDRSTDKKLIAIADDHGLVNIYKNPCLSGGKAKSYRGHSSHVVRVRFDSQDKRLYTIGGQDSTVMQWLLQK